MTMPLVLFIAISTLEPSEASIGMKSTLIAIEASACRFVLTLPLPDDFKVNLTKRYIDSINRNNRLDCALWIAQRRTITTKRHVTAGRLMTKKPWFVWTDGVKAAVTEYDPIEQMELLGGGR